MSPAGFEPAIPAGERPQTHGLDRAAAGMGDVEISESVVHVAPSQILKFQRLKTNVSFFSSFLIVNKQLQEKG